MTWRRWTARWNVLPAARMACAMIAINPFRPSAWKRAPLPRCVSLARASARARLRARATSPRNTKGTETSFRPLRVPYIRRLAQQRAFDQRRFIYRFDLRGRRDLREHGLRQAAVGDGGQLVRGGKGALLADRPGRGRWISENRAGIWALYLQFHPGAFHHRDSLVVGGG